MNGNGQQNGNGHVGQLRARDTQQDRLTMIALNDGNQAPLPSYEEALRDTTTTTATSAAETPATTANGVQNGNVHINGNVDNRSYRNTELNGTTNATTDRLHHSNGSPSMGVMANVGNSNS